MGKLMKNLVLILSALLANFVGLAASAKTSEVPGPDFYRALVMRLRPDAKFKIATADHFSYYSYHFEFGEPFQPNAQVSDAHLNMDHPNYFDRLFWDRIALKDGSYLEVHDGERIPLTCVFISGQDNRFNGQKSPVIPDYIIKVYLVANDYACQGPIHPGWPSTGGKKEAWDTYAFYEVRDPTIMLPQDSELRLLWSEFPSVLVQEGPHQ
jgi:hypothetical protein